MILNALLLEPDGDIHLLDGAWEEDSPTKRNISPADVYKVFSVL